ncbi:MAG: STAS-like domain-containing protein [Candidatus Omnitrophota bacterium]|nr:STAS-like domain-containing protein [Candidatus Omnitrophota bacterium]
MIIKLKDIIGEYCSQRQNSPSGKGGQHIRQVILDNWNKAGKIEISFDGVKLSTLSFIDEAFAKLAINYSLEQLKSKLIFSQIDEETKNKINKGIEVRIQQRQNNG